MLGYKYGSPELKGVHLKIRVSQAIQPLENSERNRSLQSIFSVSTSKRVTELLLPSQNSLDEIIGESLKLFKLQAKSRDVSFLNNPFTLRKKTRFPSKGKVGIATVETNFGDSSHCVWRLIQLLPSLRTLSHITRGCLRRCCNKM